jgi:hypothetical protein
MTSPTSPQHADTDRSDSSAAPGSTLSERIATAAPVTVPVRQDDGSWILALSLHPLDEAEPPRLRSRSTVLSRLRLRLRRSMRS